MAFVYTYSASVNSEVEAIRRKYLPQETDKVEELKRLDAAIKTEPLIGGLTIGIVGCLLFGVAMCMMLSVLDGGYAVGLILGALGILWMVAAYPIYCVIRNKMRETCIPRIRKLLDEIDGKED